MATISVEPWFSERQPSGKSRLSGNFSEHQFVFFSKNMQPSENPRKSGKIIVDRKFR